MADAADDRPTYPPFRASRYPIRQAKALDGGPVAGRYADGSLTDESGSCRLTAPLPVPEGSWVSGFLAPDGPAWLLSDAVIHAPHLADPWPADRDLHRKKDALNSRARIRRATEDFFSARGFLHVETPSRVICPAVEPHLTAVPSGERYLITSPELHLKRLLAAGYEKICEIARVFRQGESGRHHLPEFTMVEWYRAWGSLEDLMEDCECLIDSLCEELGRPSPPMPFGRFTYRELFLRFAGIDPLAEREPSFAANLGLRSRELGIDVPPGEGPEDLLERIFVHVVEPRLGALGPVFVTDYPSSQAALARTRPCASGAVAERFELYLDGLELANAFDELNDPVEQEIRLNDDRLRREEQGMAPYPRDEAYLAALAAGMPPAAGIALGFDRLVLWLLGASHIHQVVPFPEDILGN